MVGAFVEPEEVQLFLKFKKYASDLNSDDGTLIRFLRASDFDFSRAKENLKNSIAWRTRVDLHNHLNWRFPENYATDLPYTYFGKDFDGAPIYWVPAGRWALKALVEQGESDVIRKYSYSMFEQGLHRTITHSCPVNVVMDIEGLTYSQVTHLPSLRLTYEGFLTCEQNYPETIKSLSIINAPWIFSIIFSFVKATITARTMTKIRIFNSKEEWSAAFTEMFPIDSILPEVREKMISQ